MSQAPQRRGSEPTGTESPSSGDSPGTEDLFELLNDDCTRTLLASIRTEPRSARDLAEACEASRATVYRRLDRLEDAGLITSSMHLDPDGHHRKRYRTTFERAAIEISTEGFTTLALRTTHAEEDDPRVDSHHQSSPNA